MVLAAHGGRALRSSPGVGALLGTPGELRKAPLCQLAPLTAGPEGEAAKVGLGFGLALVLQLAFLATRVVQWAWCAAPLQGDAGTPTQQCWPSP